MIFPCFFSQLKKKIVNVRVNGFIDGIIKPVTQLNAQFAGVVTKVDQTLGDFDDIESSIDILSNEFDSLKSEASQRKFTTVSSSCTNALSAIEDASTTAKEGTSTAANGFVSTLKNIQTSINDNLVDAQTSIAEATQSSQDAADNMKKAVDSALNATSKLALEAARQVNDNSFRISAGPFAWAFIIPCFSIIGIILMKLNKVPDNIQKGSNPTNPNLQGNVIRLKGFGKLGSRSVACSWSCTFLLAMVSGIVAAIFMPVGLVYTDICYAIDEFPLKMGQMNGGSEAGSADILGGCWKGDSIFNILGLGDSMTFTDISFDGLDDEIDLGSGEFNAVGDNIKKLSSAGCSSSIQNGMSDAWDEVDKAKGNGKNYVLKEVITQYLCISVCVYECVHDYICVSHPNKLTASSK